MNYEGEKFLLKLYKELYNEQSIKHSSTKSDNKYEAVKKYIDRLEKIHKKVLEHQKNPKIDLLKKLYYDKYVITEENITESYMKHLDTIYFEQNSIHMNSLQKNLHKKAIVKSQEKSLNDWLEYLTSKETQDYPTWVKYWVFQGMLTIGTHDIAKGTYKRRSKNTVAPYPELDKKTLSKIMDLAIKEIKKEEIDDKTLEELIKNGNFPKLYILQLKNNRDKHFSKSTEGKWIKYNKGENYKELLKSIQGQSTGWCTVAEETCKYQLKNGDFYIYYTYDEEGNPTVPRLAIRMNGTDKIGEIRGVGRKQNIEPNFENIIDKKLEEFPDATHYKKRVQDTKTLAQIYEKYQNNITLSKDDLNFIYEVNDRVETMGLEIDPRHRKMKNNDLDRKSKHLTKEIAIRDKKSLAYLDKNNTSCKKIVLAAINQDEEAIKYIPQEIINEELIKTIKSYNPKIARKILKKASIVETAFSKILNLSNEKPPTRKR